MLRQKNSKDIMLYCVENMTWLWHILNNRCVTALIIHDPRYWQCHPLLCDKRVTQHEASNLYYNSPYLCRCSQTAILARSSREMSLTFRIVWQYILSRVRVSIRPSNLFTQKTSKSIANTNFIEAPNGHCSPVTVDRSPSTTFMIGENNDHIVPSMVAASDCAKTGKCNKSKRRQREKNVV